MRAAAALALLVPLAACQTSPEAPAADSTGAVAAPELRTGADSLARVAYDGMGGPGVWARVPYLRFDFGSRAADGSGTHPARRHLWDRRTGAYRLEALRGDTAYVVLFDTDTREGQAFAAVGDAAPVPLDTAATHAWLGRAYKAFINDTYWLLAPTKLFDPGVTRTAVPDSTKGDEQVLALAFGEVGLTPGDRYWLYVDRAAGRMTAWRYQLEGMDAPGPRIAWDSVRALPTPHGEARVAEAHRFPDGRTLYTDRVALPDSVDARFFTDPARRLDR